MTSQTNSHLLARYLPGIWGIEMANEMTSEDRHKEELREEIENLIARVEMGGRIGDSRKDMLLEREVLIARRHAVAANLAWEMQALNKKLDRLNKELEL